MRFERRHRRRIDEQGHARFLTFCANDRRPLLVEDWVRDLFVDAMRAAREKLRFLIYAWVLMPEHVHLLLHPGREHADTPRILQSIKQPVAMKVLRRWRDEKPGLVRSLTGGDGKTRFWLPGRGYDLNVFSHDRLIEKIHYIHDNPVRRKLVLEASEWWWSSALEYERGQRSNSLRIDFPD